MRIIFSAILTLTIVITSAYALTARADQNNPWDEDYMSGRECLETHIMATSPVQMWGDDVVGYFKTKEEYLSKYTESQKSKRITLDNAWTWSNGSRTW